MEVRGSHCSKNKPISVNSAPASRLGFALRCMAFIVHATAFGHAFQRLTPFIHGFKACGLKLRWSSSIDVFQISLASHAQGTTEVKYCSFYRIDQQAFRTSTRAEGFGSQCRSTLFQQPLPIGQFETHQCNAMNRLQMVMHLPPEHREARR